jgi:hypothetical protein
MTYVVVISSIHPPEKIITGTLRGKMEMMIFPANSQFFHDLTIIDFSRKNEFLQKENHSRIKKKKTVSRRWKWFQEVVLSQEQT